MPSPRFRRRHSVFVAACGVLLLVGVAVSSVGGTGPSLLPRVIATPIPPHLSTPVSSMIVVPIIEKQPQGTTRIVKSSGPQTSGSIIHVRGQQIRLPADAWVEEYYTSMLCEVGGRCPETPFLVLRRGNSILALSAPSGVIHERSTAPGEEGAFRFLEEALR